MLTNEEFAQRWYNVVDLEIKIDEIADPKLQYMYATYVAMHVDIQEAEEEIERYIDASTGKRYSIFGAGDEDAAEQPDRIRVGLSH